MKSAMLMSAALLVAFTAGCNDYGTKLDYNGSDVYYTKNVTEAEAKAVGDYLDKEGYFKSGRKSFRLDKDGNVYRFQIILDDNYKANELYPEGFKLTGARISHFALKDAPVAMVLSNNKFEELETIEADAVGKLLHHEKGELSYIGDITKEQAQQVLDLLKKKYFSKDHASTIQIKKVGDAIHLRFVVKKEAIDSPLVRITRLMDGARVGQKVFDGNKVEVHLATSNMKTQKVLSNKKKEKEPLKKTE